MKAQLLRILFAVALLFPRIINAQTTTQTIFNYGSSWKYLDNGTNQGTGWSATGFNDASWASGTGYFGYGDTWITTCVNACGTVSCSPSCGTKYITTYFRKTISISDTALYDSIRLSAYRDDGIVVYVNGVEVWRDNMPASPAAIAYNTLANSPAIGGTDETTPVSKSIPISSFISGNNVIAVELHQQAANSSDLTFNMQALGVIRTTIFSFGAPWKYLANGVDQGTAWRPSSFNDASWTVATGHIGFGETWTTTCIPAGPTCTPLPSCNIGNSCTKYNTTYLRKTISLPDLSVYDSIKFTMFRDDGIVMYVNGTEVWRDNMPTGTISYTTFAPNNITGTTGVYAESLAVVKAIPISAFATGSNTIAVELHQNSATSSDLDFNVQMTGVLHTIPVPPSPVTLSQGPYLQMGNKTAVSVRWRTNIASKSRLQVGTVAGTYPIVVNDAAAITEHELRVTGLQENTKYYYRIGTDTSIIQGDTSNFFVTAPADTSTRHITIAAFGDCGRNDNSFQTGSLASYQAYLASKNMKAADLMLLVGDNAYDAGTDAEFSANFFNRYSGNILKNHILFPAPGNHDYANNATRQVDHNVPYFSLFTVPTAAECGGVASGTEAYYSYDWGNIHILSLDSYGKENSGTTRLYDTLGAQVNWIKNDLAANNKKWTIVYFHHPPYTMGSHTSDGESELVNIRQNFIRILERYGVDMVICGHSHDYERSYLMKGHYGNEASFNKAAHTTDSSSAKYNGTANSCPYTIPSGKVNHGTVYVVSGSAGADGGVQSGYPHNALPFSIDDGGMFYIDIQDNRLDAKFLRRDNTIADQFTIMKDVKVKDTVAVLAGSPVNLTASWAGAYAWAPGVTTRTVTVTPGNDTTIVVKDSLTNTCLTDTHFVDVQCTMPAFTTCPANIQQSGCNAVVNYSVADTGRLTPVLTYAFSGATTGSGNGTGSGTTFNIGTTNVTITATNACGSATCIFNVTIDPLPAVYIVIGGGDFCTGNAGLNVGLSNSQTGVNYQLFSGASAVGSPIAGTGSVISFGTFTSTATYSVVATEVATGCTNNMSGTVTVVEHSLPVVYNVSGGGAYCAGGNGSVINISNSQTGVNYQLYNGATAAGSAVAGTGAALNLSHIMDAGTYSVVATDAITGCISNMTGSAEVIINPLPVVYTVTGGGSYCSGNTGIEAGIDNSENGISYQLYNGASAIGSALTGTGAPVSFGVLTTAATYSVLATNNITGCAAGMAGTATVIENPLPVIYNVTGTGSYCEGGTGRNIQLSNSQPGVNYQLYSGSSATGSAMAGSGSAVSFGNFTAAATYSVLATDLATGCVSNMSGNAIVSIDPLPQVFAITGGGNYCNGAGGVAVGIANSEPGVNYTLYADATPVGTAVAGSGTVISFGNVTDAATYTAVATNTTTGCSSNMIGTAMVSVNPLPVTYSLTGGGNYCSGGTGQAIGLANSQPGISYQLYTGTLASGSPVMGSGGVVSFGLRTVAGTYTVMAVDPATSCTSNMDGAATIGINPLPSIYSVTGGGNYCAGGTGVHLGLGGSATGILYQVYMGSSPSGVAVAGNGSPLDLGLFAAAGTYSAIATDALTGCVSNMLGSSAIVVNPVLTPSVTLSATGGFNLCEGTANTFIASVVNGGASPVYKWKVNGTVVGSSNIYSYVPVNGDAVSVTVTSNVLCATTGTVTASTVMVVSANVMPAVSITAHPGNIVCQGATVTLNAAVANGGTAPSFSWLKNSSVVGSGNTYSYTPAEGDDFILYMTSDKPCRLATTVHSNNISMSVRENYVPVVVISALPGTTVKPGEAVTFKAAVTDAGTNPSYQWIVNNSVISGATSATFITSNLADNDSVSCTVTATDMCGYSGRNSVIIHTQSLGVGYHETDRVDIVIMPNPNNGDFMIDGSIASIYDEQVNLTVTNVLGQVIYNKQTEASQGRIHAGLSLGNNIKSGTYLLTVNSISGTKIFHFVVSK